MSCPDATLTNVLEGARQYFQGRPSAPECGEQVVSTAPNGNGYWRSDSMSNAGLLEPQPHIIHKPSISIGSDPPKEIPMLSPQAHVIHKSAPDIRPCSRTSHDSGQSERATPHSSYSGDRASVEPPSRPRGAQYPSYPQPYTVNQMPVQANRPTSAQHSEAAVHSHHAYVTAQAHAQTAQAHAQTAQVHAQTAQVHAQTRTQHTYSSQPNSTQQNSRSIYSTHQMSPYAHSVPQYKHAPQQQQQQQQNYPTHPLAPAHNYSTSSLHHQTPGNTSHTAPKTPHHPHASHPQPPSHHQSSHHPPVQHTQPVQSVPQPSIEKPHHNVVHHNSYMPVNSYHNQQIAHQSNSVQQQATPHQTNAQHSQYAQQYHHQPQPMPNNTHQMYSKAQMQQMHMNSYQVAPKQGHTVAVDASGASRTPQQNPAPRTNNLPPIASLAPSVYSSNRRSRESLQKLTNHRHRSQSQNVAKPNPASSVTAPVRIEQPRIPMEYNPNHRYPASSNAVSSMPVPQVQYTNAGQVYPYTTVASQYGHGSSSTTTSAASTIHPSSQNTTSYQSLEPKQVTPTHRIEHPRYMTKPPYSVPTNRTSRPPEARPIPARTVLPAPKLKRESPLDLSVKTVRTSADSTAQDEAEYNDSYRREKYLSMSSSSQRSMIPPLQQPTSVAYPTFDGRSNTHARPPGIVTPQLGSPSAHKVDFLPNFGATSLNHVPSGYNNQDSRLGGASHLAETKKQPTNGGLPHMSSFKKYETAAQPYAVPVAHQQRYPNNISQNMTQPDPSMPIDPSRMHGSTTTYPMASRDLHRKRPADTYPALPNKQPRLDSNKIDKHMQDRIPAPAEIPRSFQNGNSLRLAQEYQHHRLAYAQQFPGARNHAQTYVPSASISQPPQAHPYYPTVSQAAKPAPLPRSGSHTKLAVAGNTMGADKRVLSLLRNSLEIKEAEKQKLEKELLRINENQARAALNPPPQQSETPRPPSQHQRQDFVGRHHLPFAASLIERASYTPPLYKLQVPRAVDSIKFDLTDQNTNKVNNPKIKEKERVVCEKNSANTDEAISALLAARIRTKAELKGFTPSSDMNKSNEPRPEIPVEVVAEDAPVTVDPPKLSPAKCEPCLPHNQGLSRSEEELVEPIIIITPPTEPVEVGNRDPNGIRSSSETSVFDFRDSESEGEMPVLERQSLHDLRKDRRSSGNRQQGSGSEMCSEPGPGEVMTEIKKEIDVEIKQEPDPDPEPDPEPIDPFWANTCDKFLEQLTTGGGKKRGRRKKRVDSNLLAQLETVTMEKPLSDIKIEHTVVVNVVDIVKTENKSYILLEKRNSELRKSRLEKIEADLEKKPLLPVTKVEDNSDSDEDLPLSRRKFAIKSELKDKNNEEVVEQLIKSEPVTPRVTVESSSSSSSDESDAEGSSNHLKVLSERPRTRKRRTIPHTNEADKMTLRSRDTTPNKKPVVPAILDKKAGFGDGSEFYPGWEEELYKYKRSIRMPAQLINVTRPPHWHRLSTSLPDLDPYPNSPTPSSTTDATECSQRKSVVANLFGPKQKQDLDSDIDSNSCYSFTNKNEDDDEEASCSTVISSNSKTVKADTKTDKAGSILDVLVQRYGTKKMKVRKTKEQNTPQCNTPKIIPKSDNCLKLLGTPNVGLSTTNNSNSKSPSKDKKAAFKLLSPDSVYLGSFRKQTVTNFRDAFLNNTGGLLGATEEFTPIVYKSRTRTETRVMKQRATIREVFGEDRPASAPPMTCHDDLASSQDSKDDAKPLNVKSNKIDNKKKKKLNTHLLKVIANKKLKTDPAFEEKTLKMLKSKLDAAVRVNFGTKTMPELVNVGKRKFKLRSMRRKFSSGFDYIRKKKKIVKKEEGVDQQNAIKRRRGLYSKPSPESVNDIQREIKAWVLNKGVGETHLHRAARLGYTDITAYCLEKLSNAPSPRDNAGYSPLHEACSRGHLDIARLLLQYGANVSDSAHSGIRPMHEAAENGYVEIIRLLLSFGADPLLATYSGQTPLSLATDGETIKFLKDHLADVQGASNAHWSFAGPASLFDSCNLGYDPLVNVPSPDPPPEDIDIDMEVTEFPLPPLYCLKDEPAAEQWVLLQDLSAILRIKSRDTLLKQLNPAAPPGASKGLLKELKMSDFLEKARCLQLLCAGEKINVRANKIVMVKYNDKVKQLLSVEKVAVTVR